MHLIHNLSFVCCWSVVWSVIADKDCIIVSITNTIISRVNYCLYLAQNYFVIFVPICQITFQLYNPTHYISLKQIKLPLYNRILWLSVTVHNSYDLQYWMFKTQTEEVNGNFCGSCPSDSFLTHVVLSSPGDDWAVDTLSVKEMRFSQRSGWRW